MSSFLKTDEMFEYGLDFENDDNADNDIITAVQNNKIEIVKKLIEAGADINSKNYNYETPLIIACEKDYEEIVKLLLNKKAKVNLQDKDGDTALKIAVYMKNLNIIKELLKAGADVNIENKYGQSALMLAQKKYPDIYNVLLKFKRNDVLVNKKCLLTNQIGQYSVDYTTYKTTNNPEDLIIQKTTHNTTIKLKYKRKVGKGSYGNVMLFSNKKEGLEEGPEEKEEDDNVAVKIILDDSKTQEIAIIEMLNKSFIKCNITPVKAFQIENTRTTIVIAEFMDGTMKDIITEIKFKLNICQKIQILKEITSQLNCLQNKGLYYTDLKPENVLFKCKEDLHVYLGDIGSIWYSTKGHFTYTVLNYQKKIRNNYKIGSYFVCWTLFVLLIEMLRPKKINQEYKTFLNKFNFKNFKDEEFKNKDDIKKYFNIEEYVDTENEELQDFINDFLYGLINEDMTIHVMKLWTDELNKLYYELSCQKTQIKL
jgi:hypothetical protein